MIYAIFNYLPDEKTLVNPAQCYIPPCFELKTGGKIWCVYCECAGENTPLEIFDNDNEIAAWIESNTVQVTE